MFALTERERGGEILFSQLQSDVRRLGSWHAERELANTEPIDRLDIYSTYFGLKGLNGLNTEIWRKQSPRSFFFYYLSSRLPPSPSS